MLKLMFWGVRHRFMIETIGFNLKSPEELFENNFLRVQNLQYSNSALLLMEKNSKTCARL